ncbi:nitric oxide synthase oxygenase, partial [Paenibacillus sepulcri]|nr:nitric oxide synthase oxygenase [Paenibacillus sepulcri]
MQELSIIDNKQRMEEAASFIRACYSELGKSGQEAEQRLAEIEQSIKDSGRYEHTEEELCHGAKMAWRNSNRCIGRFFWDSLAIQDARKAQTEEDAAAALLDHIEHATNGGKIRPVITVFAPERAENGSGIRIHNHQLIRYAGYETSTGSVGDPAS